MNVCNLSCDHGWNTIAAIEGQFITISRTSIGGRVGTNIIGRVNLQVGNAASEAACARTIGGMAVANGRVWARAPTYASRRHIQATVVGNVAATCGTYCSNVGNVHCRQGGNAVTRGKRLLFPVHRSARRNRVGTVIIGGVKVQPCHRCRKTAFTTSLFQIVVIRGRCLMRGPANTLHENVGSIVRNHIAASHGRIAGNQHRLRGGHRD